LHSPEVSQRVSQLGNYLRFESSLKPPELELAMLTVAREKDCSYIWGAHAEAARKAGLSDETIATVRERRDASGLKGEEAGLVTYVQQLLRKNRVEQAVFDQMLNRFGVRGLVELTALAGQYGLLAGVLNAFEVVAAPQVEQLPV
jgi:4-carboxymuconolactone decarboxylase